MSPLPALPRRRRPPSGQRGVLGRGLSPRHHDRERHARLAPWIRGEPASLGAVRVDRAVRLAMVRIPPAVLALHRRPKRLHDREQCRLRLVRESMEELQHQGRVGLSQLVRSLLLLGRSGLRR